MGMEHFDQLADAIDKFTRLRSAGTDGENMAISPKVQYVPKFGGPSLVVPLSSTTLPHHRDCWSTHNNSSLALPPPLEDFANLPYNESGSTGVSIRSTADVLKQTKTPYGLRYELRVLSFRSRFDMVKGVKTIFEEEFASIFENIVGFAGTMEFQPITKHSIAQGYSRGGNALGITEDRAPMVCQMHTVST